MNMTDKEYEERKKKEETKDKDKEKSNLKNKRNKEFADNIHMEIHAIRRLKTYKANPMEVNISKLVIERFKDECQECKEVGEKRKKQPEKKEGIFTKLSNLADR